MPIDPLTNELHRRMSQPQRHRLLQGYPMAPLMRPAARLPHPLDEPAWSAQARDPSRPLLVGVLPHASCNPSVQGCGFCTFPHERFERSQVSATASAVASEIASTVLRHPDLAARDVRGVYLGGGTANLTPPEDLAALLSSLSRSFSLAGAEISLEGAPRYFLTREARCLDLLEEIPARHRRISMGVQTFDEIWLERMGRLHFGLADAVEEAIAEAHRRGMTASIDLLFDLPGQSLPQSEADLERAIAMGVDQICLYNLVLSEDLGTVWAKDPDLLAARIPTREGCERWLSLRALLLDRGYVQTTLTNFERADLPEDKRFFYELASFTPDRYDAIGFGPHAISTLASRDGTRALKWVNAGGSKPYLSALAQGAHPVETRFLYAREDLALLHLTRGLAALAIDRRALTERLGADPFEILPGGIETLSLLARAGLVDADSSRVALTPAGMFYADTVTGLLAHARVRSLRGRDPDDDDDDDDRDNRRRSMG